MARWSRPIIGVLISSSALSLGLATRASGQNCVGCTIPIDCPVISSSNACACLIQSFQYVRICREVG